MQHNLRCLPIILTLSFLFMTIVYYLDDSCKNGSGSPNSGSYDSHDKTIEDYFRIEDQLRFRRSYNNVEYIGLPFNKSWNKYLQSFHLLHIEQVDDARVLQSKPVHVTAFSDNHYHEAKSMMNYLIQRYNGTKILYLYDLGLSLENRIELMKDYNNLITDLRRFPFDMYPDHVRSLNSYRWKPLIIAQMLSEHPSIWWMDTSVKMKGPVTTVYSIFKNCSSQGLPTCPYYTWITADNTYHSIFSATEAGMYKYLPIPETFSKNITMFGANLQLVYGTNHVKRNVLRFLTLCALEKDCMGPKDAKLYCDFKNHYTDYANCHRFDQSAVNILLAWATGFRQSAYQSLLDNAFAIERS